MYLTPKKSSYAEYKNVSMQFTSEIAKSNNANLPFTNNKIVEISVFRLR